MAEGQQLFYIRRGARIVGPTDLAGLRLRCREGKVLGTDEVANSENGPWFPAAGALKSMLPGAAAAARPAASRRDAVLPPQAASVVKAVADHDAYAPLPAAKIVRQSVLQPPPQSVQPQLAQPQLAQPQLVPPPLELPLVVGGTTDRDIVAFIFWENSFSYVNSPLPPIAAALEAGVDSHASLKAYVPGKKFTIVGCDYAAVGELTVEERGGELNASFVDQQGRNQSRTVTTKDETEVLQAIRLLDDRMPRAGRMRSERPSSAFWNALAPAITTVVIILIGISMTLAQSEGEGEVEMDEGRIRGRGIGRVLIAVTNALGVTGTAILATLVAIGCGVWTYRRYRDPGTTIVYS